MELSSNVNKLADVIVTYRDVDTAPTIRGVAVTDSADGEVDVYVGEMEQRFETQTINAVERDEDGEAVLVPVYETDPDTGEIVYEQVLDPETGDPMYDEYGYPIEEPVQAMDAEGNLLTETVPLYDDVVVLDEHGDPEMQPMVDDHGNPIVIDGETQYVPVTEQVRATEVVFVTDEQGDPVPVVDSDGNPVFDRVQLVDSDGEPIVEYDEDGWPIPQIDPDTGDPIYKLDDNGDPLPELDEDGNAIYRVDPETGEEYQVYQVEPVVETQVVGLECIGQVDEGDTPVIAMGGTMQPVVGVEGWGDQMAENAEITAQIADEAAEVANATNQHFWTDTSGAHVTDAEQDDWATEYAKPNHGDLSNPTDEHPWHNQLINSLGTLLRTGLVNLVSITRSAIAFFDGGGNTSDHVAASFGIDGARRGHTGKTRAVITDTNIAFANGTDTMFYVGGTPTSTIKTYKSFGTGALGPIAQQGMAPYIGYDVWYQHEHGGGCEDIYIDGADDTAVFVYASLDEPEPALWLYDKFEDVWFDADDLADHEDVPVTVYSKEALASAVVPSMNAYRVYFRLRSDGYAANDPLPWEIRSTFSVIRPSMALSDVFSVDSSGNVVSNGYVTSHLDVINGYGDQLSFKSDLNHNHDSDYAPISHNHAAGDIDSGTLGITYGGTGQSGIDTTTAITTIITAASSTTITAATFRKWGKFAQLNLSFRRSSSWSANTTVDVGTLKSGYMPIAIVGGGNANVLAHVNGSGLVRCRNMTGSAIATTTTQDIGFAFIVS